MTNWQRTYAIVFASNFITAVGMLSFLPFFPAVLANLGVDDFEERMAWTGVLFGAAPLVAAIMGPIWGSIGDRFGRKLMLLRALAAIAVFVGAMGFATSPWQLLALRLGQGIFSGFVPPSITLVSVVTPREHQGRVTGSLQAALPLGMIVGPLVGGFIQDRFGVREMFFFVSAAATVSALLVGFFVREEASLRAVVERFSPSSVLTDTARDLRAFLANRSIRRALWTLFAVQLGIGATAPQLQNYVSELILETTGSAPTTEHAGWLTAWLFTALALAGVVSTPLWGWIGDRFNHARALLAASIATGSVLGLTAFVPSYLFLVIARVATGLTAPGASVAAFGVAAVESSGDRRGGAFAVIFSARALALSIGSIVGGLAGPVFGIRGLFIASGTTVALVLIVLRAGARKARDDS